MMATTVDPARLARAVHLEAERVGGGVWCVGEWRVDGATGACNCPDALYRPRTPCKHSIACRLAVLDDELREALRTLIEVAP